jgi:hypothetical protein
MGFTPQRRCQACGTSMPCLLLNQTYKYDRTAKSRRDSDTEIKLLSCSAGFVVRLLARLLKKQKRPMWIGVHLLENTAWSSY